MIPSKVEKILQPFESIRNSISDYFIRPQLLRESHLRRRHLDRVVLALRRFRNRSQLRFHLADKVEVSDSEGVAHNCSIGRLELT